jgi:hypothetical protein
MRRFRLGGVPREDTATFNDGAVHVFYGARRHLTLRANQFLTQETPGMKGDGAQDGDGFGPLGAGDFNGDGRDDLAIGEAQGDVRNAIRPDPFMKDPELFEVAGVLDAASYRVADR